MKSFSQSAFDTLNTHDAYTQSRMSHMQSSLLKQVNGYLKEKFIEDYNEFIDNFKGSIREHTEEDLQKFFKEKQDELMKDPQNIEPERMFAHMIAANATHEETCAVPAVPNEMMKFGTTMEKSIEQAEQMLIDEIREQANPVLNGYLQSPHDSYYIDLLALRVSKGAFDARQTIHNAVKLISDQVEAHGFVTVGTDWFIEEGVTNEFLFTHAEWEDGSSKTEVKKVQRNDEGVFVGLGNADDITGEVKDFYLSQIIQYKKF